MLLFVILTIISAVIAIPLPPESGGAGASPDYDAIRGVANGWVSLT